MMMMMMMMEEGRGDGSVREPRAVVRKFLARPQQDGVRAVVRRSIGRFELRYFDPFLVLDEFSVTAPGGSRSSAQRIRDRDIHATGIHDSRRFQREQGDDRSRRLAMDDGRTRYRPFGDAFDAGNSEGIAALDQPISQHKMIEPRYQEMPSGEIPEASRDRVKVRVIAGEALGAKSPIYTRTPAMYLDLTLDPGSYFEQPIPPTWNAFVYVLEGEGMFGNTKSSAHYLLLLGEGDGLVGWNKSSRPVRFVLVGGEVIGEPVAQLGPFVMNTEEEIATAIYDYENRINGFEKANIWM